jgi:hypothetical protein
VVVAARAVHRQAEHAASGGGDEIVEILVAPLRIVLLAKRPRAGRRAGTRWRSACLRSGCRSRRRRTAP